MAKNLKGKTRPPSDPYEVVYSPQGWKHKVLKHYASTEKELTDPYSRVFCEVEGDYTEMGDVYIHHLPELVRILKREVQGG